MTKFYDEYDLEIGQSEESPFLNRVGVYQDGTTPMYRDENGVLWAMSGHSHMGHIGVFRGTSLDDMKEFCQAQTNFAVGHAEHAFDGVRYPEGILPRGSIWPFGLYIAPDTHRFFCWFHNETGWNGKGTAYDAYGLCREPKYDSDFRHVGLMHSDDEGKNWFFDRWVLTGEQVAFTENFNPGAGSVLGQKRGVIRLGSGDFSIFVEPDGEYIYLFYNVISLDTEAKERSAAWKRCDVCVARARKRGDGAMGDFVKYFDGSFSEAGNLGKETPICESAWHPRVVYRPAERKFLMTSKRLEGLGGASFMQIAVSDDLVHWSEPQFATKDGQPWGNHYNAVVAEGTEGQPHILVSDCVSILTNHNGTDVLRTRARLTRKK